MMIPPYLRKGDLYENMTARPCEPFFVSPGDYRVVDGDTFAILADGLKFRKTAFRIRLFSVNTPELPKGRGADAGLRSVGINPFAGSPGDASRVHVSDLCRDRALFVEPCINDEGRLSDKYGRLLANVCLSGSPGDTFDVRGAFALEPYLVRSGHGVNLKNKELPPATPAMLWQIGRALSEREKRREEGSLDCSL